MGSTLGWGRVTALSSHPQSCTQCLLLYSPGQAAPSTTPRHARRGLIRTETGKGSTAGKEEEEEEGRRQALCKGDFSAAHTHTTQMFPQRKQLLVFKSVFHRGSLSTRSSHRVPKALVAAAVRHSQVPAWEVWVFHRAKEAPHCFDYREKLEQPNVESLK